MRTDFPPVRFRPSATGTAVLLGHLVRFLRHELRDRNTDVVGLPAAISLYTHEEDSCAR